MMSLDFPKEFSNEQQQVEEEIRKNRSGQLAPLFNMLLHSPEVARGWAALGTAIRFRTSLSDDVRELLIYFTALRTDCPVEVTWHHPMALEAGVPQEVLDDLGDWRASQRISDQYRTVLAVGECALQGKEFSSASPNDDAMSATTVVEIYALVVYYAAVAQFLNGTGLAETFEA